MACATKQHQATSCYCFHLPPWVLLLLGFFLRGFGNKQPQQSDNLPLDQTHRDLMTSRYATNKQLEQSVTGLHLAFNRKFHGKEYSSFQLAGRSQRGDKHQLRKTTVSTLAISNHLVQIMTIYLFISHTF